MIKWISTVGLFLQLQKGNAMLYLKTDTLRFNFNSKANSKMIFLCFCLHFKAVSVTEKHAIDKIIDVGPQLSGTLDYYVVHSKLTLQ